MAMRPQATERIARIRNLLQPMRLLAEDAVGPEPTDDAMHREAAEDALEALGEILTELDALEHD